MYYILKIYMRDEVETRDKLCLHFITFKVCLARVTTQNKGKYIVVVFVFLKDKHICIAMRCHFYGVLQF